MPKAAMFVFSQVKREKVFTCDILAPHLQYYEDTLRGDAGNLVGSSTTGQQSSAAWAWRHNPWKTGQPRLRGSKERHSKQSMSRVSSRNELVAEQLPDEIEAKQGATLIRWFPD